MYRRNILMNKSILKRIVAVVLSLVMLAGVGTTAFAAVKRTPVIVVNGMENNPLFNNYGSMDAEKVWPPDEGILSDFEKGLFGTSLFRNFDAAIAGTYGLASNDYKETLNYFVGSKLYKDYQLITLNPDGTSMSQSIGAISYPNPASYYNNPSTDEGQLFVDEILGGIGESMCSRYGANNVYIYTYDWRLDPLTTALELNEYIKDVKRNAKATKVKIISEGYGSTIAMSYLATCLSDAKNDVSNFVTVNSAFMGTSLVGDFFTGNLYSAVTDIGEFSSAFIRFTNDRSDNPVTAFSTWLTNYILNKNWEVQDLAASIAVMMSHIKPDLYNKYVRSLSQTMVGLWAMVPTEYYEDALDFMYMTEDYEDDENGCYNEVLLDKIQRFKDIQDSANVWINQARKAGIAVEAVSSWDLQMYPIGNKQAAEEGNFGLNSQSDGLIDTHYSSFGAACVPLNNVGQAVLTRQLMKVGACKNHNHLSATYDQLDPDGRLAGIAHYIDASTCIMPDNTWFIHNMKHGTFSAESNAADLLVFLLDADTRTTVFTNAKYNQFMSYNRYLKPGVLTFPTTSDKKLDPKYMLGDVDLDGKVQANDARYALRISARLEPYPDESTTKFKNADVDGNGKIESKDARIILRVSAHLASFDEYYKTVGAREVFKQDTKDNVYVMAQVEGEKITVYICSKGEQIIYWRGSFVEPSNTAKTYTVLSKADSKDKALMDKSILATKSTALQFAVVNNVMKVKVKLPNAKAETLISMKKVK